MTSNLDQAGFFHQDELIEYLLTNHSYVYTETEALRQAVKLFDYDGDGKIMLEEFEYFMKNFGESE